MRLISTSISSLLTCQADRLESYQIFTKKFVFSCFPYKTFRNCIVLHKFALNLVKFTKQLNLRKIKIVNTCQRSDGSFNEDCKRLYSTMIKTNKRSGNRVNSGRTLVEQQFSCCSHTSPGLRLVLPECFLLYVIEFVSVCCQRLA